MSIKLKALCTAIALSGMSLLSTQTAAHADNVTFKFRFGNQSNHNVHQAYPHPPMYAQPIYRAPPYAIPRPGYQRPSCSPRRALRIARRDFDVRGADISRMNRDRIVVSGRRPHQRVRLVFANKRGCPIISQRVRWTR